MSKKLVPAPHLLNIDNLNENMRCTYYVKAVMDMDSVRFISFGQLAF